MGKLKLLVAEDNAFNMMLMCEILEQYGAEFVTSKNGKEALACFVAEDFDAVLLDAQMPEMDGFEAAKKMRAAETLTSKHTPIVVLSGFSMDYLKGDEGEEVFDYYMRKPLEMAEVWKLLDVIKGKINK